MLDEPGQGDRMCPVEPQVGEPRAAFEFVEIVRERLLACHILAPHHRVADREELIRPRRHARVAVVEPVVVAQVVGHSVVRARLERLIPLPESWNRQDEDQREEADRGPLAQAETNRVREIRPGHPSASRHVGDGAHSRTTGRDGSELEIDELPRAWLRDGQEVHDHRDHQPDPHRGG